jgi:hypothetical protein
MGECSGRRSLHLNTRKFLHAGDVLRVLCVGRRRKLITDAARELERSKMARFDEKSGNLYVTGESSCIIKFKCSALASPCLNLTLLQPLPHLAPAGWPATSQANAPCPP